MATVASLAYSIVADTAGFVAGMRQVESVSAQIEESYVDLGKRTGELEEDTTSLREEYQALADAYELVFTSVQNIASTAWQFLQGQFTASIERLQDLGQASRELGMTAGELEAWRRASQEAFGDPTHLEKLNEEQRELLTNQEEFGKLLERQRVSTEFLTEGVEGIQELTKASNELLNIWNDIIDSITIGFVNALPTGYLDNLIARLRTIADLTGLGLRENFASTVGASGKSLRSGTGIAGAESAGNIIAALLQETNRLLEEGNRTQVAAGPL